MPRFYFHLASRDSHILDDRGKELATLSDAYEHARKLIHKILFHVGHEDAEAWKVIVLTDDPHAQMIIPFTVSNAFKDTEREDCAPQQVLGPRRGRLRGDDARETVEDEPCDRGQITHPPLELPLKR